MAKKTTKKKTLGAKKATTKKTGKAPKPAKPMVQKRADLGADIGAYFTKLNGEHRKIAETLRAIIEKAAPRASSAIKWGMPVFEHGGMLCYIRARPKYVTFGFYEAGTSLTDPDGLLEGSGDNMRHIKVRNIAAIKPDYFGRMVREAVAFNQLSA